MLDVSRALDLAERNIANFPKDGRFHTTLGIAQYRAGRLDKAIATLKSNGTLQHLQKQYLQIYLTVPTIQP